MRRRWRVMLIVAAVVVTGVAFTAINSATLRATYWTARAENCGTLSLAGSALATPSSNARHAETCYAQAAARCQPAVLAVNNITADSNGTYSFLVEPSFTQSHACGIAVIIDESNGSGDNNATMSCQSVTQTDKALRFAACGELGDVTLPAIQAAIGAI